MDNVSVQMRDEETIIKVFRGTRGFHGNLFVNRLCKESAIKGVDA